MPFEELQHTADVSLHVWADDLPALFVEAARGMNALSGIRLAQETVISRIFTADAADPESALVAFLSELAYAAEHEQTGFSRFTPTLTPQRLQVSMEGAPLLSISRCIKAVTYHNLAIRQTPSGVEVDIVFDV